MHYLRTQESETEISVLYFLLILLQTDIQDTHIEWEKQKGCQVCTMSRKSNLRRTNFLISAVTAAWKSKYRWLKELMLMNCLILKDVQHKGSPSHDYPLQHL